MTIESQLEKLIALTEQTNAFLKGLQPPAAANNAIPQAQPVAEQVAAQQAQAAQIAQATQQPPAQQTQQPAPEAKPADPTSADSPLYKECQAAVAAFVPKFGGEAMAGVFAEFGAQRIPNLAIENRQAFINRCNTYGANTGAAA
jgi:biotin carboxyl carrier protein